MPGATDDRGYPYPEPGDDPGTQASIQALAEAVDDDVQGVVTALTDLLDVAYGTLAARPAANDPDATALYYADDEHALFLRIGTARWALVAMLVDDTLRPPDLGNMDVTYTGTPVTTITYKDQSGGGGVRRAEDTITYNADGTMATLTRRFYSTDGVTVLSTTTETFSYTSGALTGVARTVA